MKYLKGVKHQQLIVIIPLNSPNSILATEATICSNGALKEDQLSCRNMLIQRGHCVRVQFRAEGQNSLKIVLKGAGGWEREECGGIQRLEL